MNELQHERIKSCTIFFAICFFLLAQPAEAYFDLGMCTFMVQLIFGFLTAVWLSMRTTCLRFGRKFQGKSLSSGNQSQAEVGEEPQENDSHS